METKVNYTLVGLFVLVLGAALIGGVLWLIAGETRLNTERYLVYMTESVSGLSEDAPVKYKGVDVGRIVEIGLANSLQVRLLLEIQENTPVTRETRARLESQGVTGIGYLNLFGGDIHASSLGTPRGEDYPVIESSPSLLGRLDTTLTAMSENLIEMSAGFKSLLKEDNRRAFARTLAHLETLTGDLAGDSDAIATGLSDFAAAMGTIRTSSDRLPRLMNQLESTLTSLDSMTAEVADAGASLNQTVEVSGSDVQRFTAQLLPEVSVIVAELRQAAENLRQVSEELARDPSRLIYPAPERAPGPGE